MENWPIGFHKGWFIGGCVVLCLFVWGMVVNWGTTTLDSSLLDVIVFVGPIALGIAMWHRYRAKGGRITLTLSLVVLLVGLVQFAWRIRVTAGFFHSLSVDIAEVVGACIPISIPFIIARIARPQKGR
jgi:hypothetical protein